MSRTYRHTQLGYVTVVGSLAAFALVSAFGSVGSLGAGGGVLGVVLLAVAVLFCTLTVEVGSEALVCRFGPGLIRRELPVADIESVEVVRNRWYDGFGIHYRNRRWLWNVSGLRGVELRLRDGGAFQIGSDEPDALAQAIREQLVPS